MRKATGEPKESVMKEERGGRFTYEKKGKKRQGLERS